MKRVPKSATSPSRSSGQVRVIAGQWRGRKLPVKNAEGLRPTTDRTKETLFNWLMHDLANSRCLDAFAGSGGLGIEALSRYAQECVFIEADKSVANELSKNLQLLKANGCVIHQTSPSAFNSLEGKFDIAFIDPPFNKGLVVPTIDALIENALLNVGAKIYVEQEASIPMPAVDSRFDLIKEKSTKALSYALYEYLG